MPALAAGPPGKIALAPSATFAPIPVKRLSSYIPTIGYVAFPDLIS